MKNRLVTATLLTACIWTCTLHAQVCDPGVTPSGLTSVYVAGVGALLEWEAVPGSMAIQLKANLPSGTIVSRNLIGLEIEQFVVPDALLNPGVYTWRVQAACNLIPPFTTTLVSAANSFVVPGSGTCPTTVTDTDGNLYPTVETGGQCWMAANLKTEHYRNGDPILTGLSNSIWSTVTDGALAMYQDMAINKSTYGLLYNWFAVNDSRGLCPLGWHVPTDGQFDLLTSYLGGLGIAGGKLKSTGTVESGTGLWHAPNAAATNLSGYAGHPGGLRDSGGNYYLKADFGFWWTSTLGAFEEVWGRRLNFYGGDVIRFEDEKRYGFSVRCLKD